MSQNNPPPPSRQDPIAYMTPGGMPAQTNTPGLVGFILAMVGLIGICVSPMLVFGVIGTVLCAIGVFRRPRGLAIAGLIVGAIEMLVGLVIVLFIGTILGGAAVGFNAAVKAAQTMQTGMAIRAAVDAQKQKAGTLPATLAAVPGLASTSDGWGHPIHYVPDAPTRGEFELVSDGPDGRPGTADDVRIDASSTVAPTTAP